VGFALLFFLSSCGGYVVKFTRHGVPDVYDYKIFNNATLVAPQKHFEFKQIPNFTLPPADLWACGEKPGYKLAAGYNPEQFLDESGTLALIVIRRDTVLYEYYANGHSRESVSTVFSITKSFLSTLVGMAIDEGKIKSVDQPVSDFIPAFAEGDFAKINIGHLLQMTSGIKFGDHDNIIKLGYLYYTRNQERLVKHLKIQHEPGTNFSYSSMSSLLLGYCLQKATGERVSDYLQKKIWTPLGMENNGFLALDHESGMAKTYGGIAASAIDLAKLGRLFLNNGNWNGEQIVPTCWTSACRTRAEGEGKAWNYANHWWLDTYGGIVSAENKNDFFAGGFRGQVIYVNPEDSTIIVRVGTSEEDIRWGHTISKLGMLPLGPDGDEFMELGDDVIASLNGSYGNKKKNRSLKVHFDKGKIMVEDLFTEGPIELVKDGMYSYVNVERNIKVIFNYSKHHVQGLILENAGEETFFSKLEIDEQH
jgi:CubicO group peptidase (beta-lactamase class C family)